ncbi:MAG TPA: ATP-binding cassette domain-containing protein [Syntrophales bacterium]|nr:ATP-binding cassette domain-containing protein [Syntrophales bacterium]
MSPSDRDPVIIVENLTARYDDVTILENVSFEVYRGERFMILGGSGCGKSTLLKHMIGLLKPSSGRVLINGIDITQADERWLQQVRRQIGVLFQADALFGSMSLAQNVALPLTEYTDLSPELVREIVKMKLGLVDLSGYDNHMPAELSGGMRKRAGLARAMALDPMFLFFDEPWAGLDPVTAAELDILIRSINEGIGTTMVFVTQELASIFNLGQRVIMLHKEARGIIARGTPAELREKSTDSRVMNFFNRHAV